MGKYGALISGSFAVQFFERVWWAESDLDIFVECSEKAYELERYLCEEEGYHLTRERGSDEDEVYEVLGDVTNVYTPQRFIVHKFTYSS